MGSDRSPRRLAALAAAIGAVALLTACGEENAYVAPPPPQVTVADALLEEVTDYLTFTGTAAAAARADIPARVSGVLKAQHFEPGSTVSAGDLLFTIEPEEFEAAVDIAEAQLSQAEAAAAEAQKAFERARQLLSRGNVSQASFDEAEARRLLTEADVKAAAARLRDAQINLGYTSITAPFDGRVGRAFVDIGNLVGPASGTTVLTDLTTFDPIYVYFTLNERDLLAVLDRMRGDGASDEPVGDRPLTPLELGLANSTDYPISGVVDFAGSEVDSATGTLELRGIFQNPGAVPEILPGMFTRLRMPLGVRSDVPLVSDRAVLSDQRGSYVLVLGADNVVERREVTTGALIDGLRVIESGIEGGERIIVNGLQRARPGATVNPAETIDMASLKTSARLARRDP